MPSLLDLILTNKPDPISSQEMFANHCSEHLGVICKINCKPDVIIPQIMMVRDRNHLTGTNVMQKVEENKNLS